MQSRLSSVHTVTVFLFLKKKGKKLKKKNKELILTESSKSQWPSDKESSDC